MNDLSLKFIAKKAGFVFFEDTENHTGRAGMIDWSNDYDDALKTFANIIAVIVERKILTDIDHVMRQRCNEIVLASFGKELAHKWWMNDNKAFNKTPNEQWRDNPMVVYNYLMKAHGW